MARQWKETIPPKFMHQEYGIYSGWMKEMDRCWVSDDGYTVCSRLIRTEIGTVEHATIVRTSTNYEDETNMSSDGSRDIPWKVKQEIKDEVFGESRTVVEVFPDRKNLVDVCDVYHMWVLPKNFRMPFGIGPKDKKTPAVNRGVPGNIMSLVENGQEIMNARKAQMHNRINETR